MNEFKTIIKHWEVVYNFSIQYFGIKDLRDNKELFVQGEESEIFLNKLEELGVNTDFIDWFYNNEYDLAMCQKI